VAHTCNPIYLGGWRSRGSQFEASPDKQFKGLYLQITELTTIMKLISNLCKEGLWHLFQGKKCKHKQNEQNNLLMSWLNPAKPHCNAHHPFHSYLISTSSWVNGAITHSVGEPQHLNVFKSLAPVKFLLLIFSISNNFAPITTANLSPPQFLFLIIGPG
jgi:hypothetical protein